MASIALPLVVVDWLSRRWDAAVAGAVVAHTLIGTASAEDPGWFLQAQALLMSIAVIVGMALRQYEHRLAELAEREARLRLEFENEELRVRSEIALALHDSIATDLAQVVVTGQNLSQDLPAGSERDRARAMVEAGQQAMVHLRGIMEGLRQSSSALRDEQVDLAATVAECRRMLESRGLGLEVDASMPWEELLRGVELPARRLLALVLREGAVNALKYAPDGSMVRVEVERVEGRVALEVSSARGAGQTRSDSAETMRRRGLSGGTGLSGLAMRAARFGGKVVYGPAGDRWLVGATVPVRSRAQVDYGAPDTSQIGEHR
ncbi:sensor histidine kinase [Actinomyces qiguomingii]|uniref:sensor histidine kinase n=1 Tax=Actinomyces qiguomingii TaxID=2057800 RepID=UPI000FFF5ADF|nr:hypothetical protein [Actinomyces qiguomingii]